MKIFNGLGVLIRLGAFIGSLFLITAPCAFAYEGVSGATDTRQPYDEAKLALIAASFPDSVAPEKVAYSAAISANLLSKLPILALPDLQGKEAEAQRIMLADPRLVPATRDPQTKKPLRSEVMTVKPALPGDRVGAETACWEGGCYRVEIYNFFHNVTITGLVDTTKKQVVSINSLPESQPELSERLKQLSIAIARHEPAVRLEVSRYLQFLGKEDNTKDVLPVMIDTKSALKDTLCERSKHLCVAPTYVMGNKAMWVIVDLTDMKVVGLRWTDVGNSGPPTVITERKLENEYVFKNFCEQVNSVEQRGWSFDYHITTSDGLRIANAKFKKQSVFRSAKVVDWHVSYSRKDKFGYSDATGCPMFSSAVVVAFKGPEISPIVEAGNEVGFSISQDFRQQNWPAPCNYRYEERYEFYDDGRYRVAMVNHGRGCGDYATYRPILRIDLGGSTDKLNYVVERWADEWKLVEQESWSRQKEPARLASSQFSHRISDASGAGYLMAPSHGQFNDGGRGDNAFIYLTVNHPDKDEGDRDLVTLGTCCNTGHEQGPELFMKPVEALQGQSIVLWYVPQLKNDDTPGDEYCWAQNDVVSGVVKTRTWPCAGGPMFVPLSRAGGE